MSRLLYQLSYAAVKNQPPTTMYADDGLTVSLGAFSVNPRVAFMVFHLDRFRDKRILNLNSMVQK